MLTALAARDYIVMAYPAMACTTMAYVVMAFEMTPLATRNDMVMAHTAMAYTAMTYVVMASS